MSHKLRTTFYSLVLAFALSETALGVVSALIQGFSPFLIFFGSITGAFSLITWIWISVLLSYNNRPSSTHALTRMSIHFYSFLSFVPIWLALAIMIFSQVPFECNFERPSDGEASVWCGISTSVGSIAMIICILSAISAIIIRKGSSDMSLHVCSGDGTDTDTKELLARGA